MKYLPRLSIAAAVITTTFICKVQAAAVDDDYYGADAPSFNIVEDNFQGIQPHDILEEKPAMEKPGKKQKQRQQKDDKNDDGPHPIVKIKGPDDYCFFLPPGPDMEVAPNEKIGVPYCTRRAVVPGNRVFPKGFVTVAHYEEADNFVQVTGYIDSSKAGLIPNDQGGQVRKPPRKYIVMLLVTIYIHTRRFRVNSTTTMARANPLGPNVLDGTTLLILLSPLITDFVFDAAIPRYVLQFYIFLFWKTILNRLEPPLGRL